jgi:DNA-binding FadR family transcriptional regulator
MVAAALRERIVSGEMDDDATLPTLDRLVDEFGVSAPSVREALRILENEGLITVRRGNVGGAVVHRPKAEGAAYMLGLVLQSRNVGVLDLASAVGELLTVCAGLCARRKDRARAVVPHLRRDLTQAEAKLDDTGVAYERVSKAFHHSLVGRSGNESIILLFGTLDWLWSAQEEAWARRVEADDSPDPKLRREGLASHKAIVDAIVAGDADLAARLTRDHVQHPDIFGLARRANHIIRATNLVPGRVDLSSLTGDGQRSEA